MADSQRSERVTTTCGPVVGFTRDDVVHWRSIPYARPPVGPLRLRAPQPPAPWRIARYCDKFAFAAPQRPLYSAVFCKFRPTSEDCLTLNITAPARVSDKPLPVMVYIHGGAYIIGTSSIYDWSHLAREGCIFVTPNYRVGTLGCMDLSSLSTPEYPIDSNLFLRDQVMALQWVRDNIANFGGDPDRVTISGTSAGAHSVMTLLATPAARGLFSGAIIQSTTVGLVRSAEEATEFAAQLAALLGARPEEGAATLMHADCTQLVAAVDQMLKATTTEMVGVSPFAACVDGDYLPRDPVEAMALGEANPATLMVGSTVDEGRMFTKIFPYMPLDESRIEEMLAVADPAVRQQVRNAYPGYPKKDVCIQLGGDRYFGMGGWHVAEAYSQHHPTYAYRYDYTPRIQRRLGIGATHGTDLLAVLNLYRKSRIGRLLTAAGDQRSARRVGDDLQSRWLNFTATGNPGDDWPAYVAPERAVMIFDRKSRVEADPVAAKRLAWQEFDRAG
jgi:para-nitrobenzyl esterase